MKNRLPLVTLATLVAGLAVGLPAQGTLIGFGADPVGANPAILRQVLCNQTREVCTAVLPAPVADHAGGAAFDPRRNTVWHTEGTRLFQVGATDCAPGCVFPAAFALGAGSLVGGLSYDAPNSRLIHVESVPGTGALVEYGFRTATDCGRPVTRCQFPLPTPRHLAGAVTHDPRTGLRFVATSRFLVGADPQNRIVIVDRRCNVQCFVPARSCGQFPLGPIRAMTYQACSNRLYVSDGRQTTVFTVQPTAANCYILSPESCCPTNAVQGQFWAGFDIEPIDRGLLGGGCLPRVNCAPCAVPPSLDTLGAATIGNAFFGLRIDDAPVNSNGFVLVQPGGCTPAPFGCGTLFAPAAPLVLGPIATAGGACAATADFTLPIPAATSLCNVLLCTQGVLICPAGGIGLTNAKVIPIQG